MDSHEIRFALLFFTIKKFLKNCAAPYPSIVIESEEKNDTRENKPAGSLYLHEIAWLQVFSYLFLKDKVLYSCVSKDWYRLIHSSAVCEEAVPFMREDKSSWYILPVKKIGNHWDLIRTLELPVPWRIRKYSFKGELAFARYANLLFGYVINDNTSPYLDQIIDDQKTITTFDSLVKLHTLDTNQVISLNRLNTIEKITIAALLEIKYQEPRAPTVNEFRQSLKNKPLLSRTNETIGQMALFNPQGRVLEFVGNRKYYFAHKKIDRLLKVETVLTKLFVAWVLTYTAFKKSLENLIDSPLPAWGGYLILVPIAMLLVVSYFKSRLVDSALNDRVLNSSLNQYASNELIYSFFPEINRSRKNLPIGDLKSEKTQSFKMD